MGNRGSVMALESKIESIKIQGFRSLADVELKDLPDAAVLIGPNGSGKSNFIRFLDMMHLMLRSRQLGTYVVQHGGADDQLYGGPDTTPELSGDLVLRTASGRSGYTFTLAYAMLDRLYFEKESFWHLGAEQSAARWSYDFGSSHREAGIADIARSNVIPGQQAAVMRNMLDVFRHRLVYQFNDTTYNSDFKKSWDVKEGDHLLFHGGNLAAVLYRLEQADNKRYDYICRQIRRVLPNFERFVIEEAYGKVSLRWKATNSDKTIGAHLTSDGSLRSFALITLLNLPPEMLPSIILLDEPELGLHPTAISLIGAMIKRVSLQRQVIVATQSPLLVDEFTPDEIFVMELEDGQTKVSRQDEEYLKVWLEEYSTGELWQKNVLGGRP